MEIIFRSTEHVGDIVATFPGASNLFKAQGIDFCCGGGRSLKEVLLERGIPEAPFMERLHHAYYEAQHRKELGQTDWRTAPLSALVNRIISVHHAYLKQELPLLSGFVTKIDQVHGDRHPELSTLNRLFHELKGELETHLMAEEETLFPLVLQYEQSGGDDDLALAVATLNRLESEHQAVGQLLAAMRKTTAGYQLPQDACRTYTITFQKLADLESDTFQHIHLENNLLFARLRHPVHA